MRLKSIFTLLHNFIYGISIVLFLSAVNNIPITAEPIQFGIMSVAQPARIHKQWQPFVDYISKKSDYKIKIVIPRGFNKIKKKIANKHIDMLYQLICILSVKSSRQSFSISANAKPGKQYYG